MSSPDLTQRAPDYVRAIAPYQGGRPIGEIARRFGFSEDQVVKLASNENPLGMSPQAKKAMLRASEDLGRYPDGNGFELKQAIAKKFGLGKDDILINAVRIAKEEINFSIPEVSSIDQKLS